MDKQGKKLDINELAAKIVKESTEKDEPSKQEDKSPKS